MCQREADCKGPARTLKWDAWDRMVEVRKKSDNSLIAKFAYDGLTRRTTKTDANDKATHFYYNLDWRAVEERIDASTNPSKVYYWGAQNRWELVRRDRDTNGNGTFDETLYCLRDAMDPVAILDGSGNVQERFQYTAFGKVTFLEPDYSLRNASEFDWEFLFHGEFRDEESGYYNYGFRYYVAELGRWLNRDPIGETGGVNLYRLVGNNSVLQLDLFGNLFEWVPIIGTFEQLVRTWLLENYDGFKVTDYKSCKGKFSSEACELCIARLQEWKFIQYVIPNGIRLGIEVVFGIITTYYSKNPIVMLVAGGAILVDGVIVVSLSTWAQEKMDAAATKAVTKYCDPIVCNESPQPPVV